MDEDDDREAVVLDNGTGQMKAGYSGDDSPSAFFANCVGYYTKKNPRKEGEPEFYIGEEAYENRERLALKYPLDHGMVNDWDDMEKIWRYTFDEKLNCCVGAEDEEDEDIRGVMVTEPSNNPRADREKTCEIMFETFGVRRFYLGLQAVLALYASGRTTGVVADIGTGVSHTIPVYHGYSVPRAVMRNNLAGRDLTNWMCQLLMEDKISLTTSAERETANEIKEETCYVAMDFEAELKGFENTKDFSMPDGKTVSIKDQRIRCPELLFRPDLDGLEMPGIHELINQTILKCDMDTRKEMWGSIVLSGGSTLFENFEDRLTKELQDLVPGESITAKVVAVPERAISVFIGAALLTGLSTFDEMWIPKDSDPAYDIYGYDEVGPSIVHQMCDF